MGRKEYYEVLTLDFEEFLLFREENKIQQLLFEEHKIPL
jgi:hypothetical protein